MIKKIITTVIATLAITGAANAQTEIKNPTVFNKGWFDITPEAFGKDNKIFLAVYDDEEDVATLSVYNDAFQLQKTFNVNREKISEKYTVQYRQYTYKDIIKDNQWSDVEAENLTEGEARQKVQEFYPIKDEKRVDNVLYMYIEYYEDNKNYPSLYFAYYPNLNGKLERVNISYRGDNWGPWGDWGEAEEREESFLTDPLDLYSYTNALETDEFYLTQTLFNTDDSYEYIMPMYKMQDIDSYYDYYDDNNNFPTRHVKGTKAVCVGYKVVNDKGNTVATINFPDNMYDEYRYGSVRIMNLNGNTYFMARVESNESYTLVYKIDNASGSVTSACEPIKVAVRPTMPEQGTQVTVSLNAAAENNAEVIVTSLAGNTVMRHRIEPGTNTTTINTATLSNGVYVVSVKNGNTTAVNTKIVVR